MSNEKKLSDELREYFDCYEAPPDFAYRAAALETELLVAKQEWNEARVLNGELVKKLQAAEAERDEWCEKYAEMSRDRNAALTERDALIEASKQRTCCEGCPDCKPVGWSYARDSEEALRVEQDKLAADVQEVAEARDDWMEAYHRCLDMIDRRNAPRIAANERLRQAWEALEWGKHSNSHHIERLRDAIKEPSDE